MAAHHTFGAHPNASGTWFRVWAPRADAVSLIGDFNDWNPETHPLRPIGEDMSKSWEIYVRNAPPGTRYKYRIHRFGHFVDKADPFAFEMEPPSPGGSATRGMAAIVPDLAFEWTDQAWIRSRDGLGDLKRPVSMYEVHLGSWRRHADGRQLTYRELADPLIEHVLEMGFTHVELMPVMEHPFYGSWGYQVTGYFAPTGRYGKPADFKYLVNRLHEAGIGVLLDWVPAHFATDPQCLVAFDGEPLYEYTDPVMRHHPDWGTYVFDYTRPQVRNFLLSNALFWLDEYHIDGLRIDAVASMIYRDYSRKTWTPNRFGGRENLEAVELLKTLNEAVYSTFPDVMMIAEESTAWPGVSHPTYSNGLGFLYKWNMGWMNDTLQFFRHDPLHRLHYFHDFTFPLVYAWSENYILALSHDEVVHGKGSLFGKMPGDDWHKSANLRMLFAHQFGHPGKKLLFMGMEFGQGREWNHDRGLDWWLLDADDAPAVGFYSGLLAFVRALNTLYWDSVALHDDAPGTFEWIEASDLSVSVSAYERRTVGSGGSGSGPGGSGQTLVFVFNFTPVPRPGYRLGLPAAGDWTVLLNSDAPEFAGSGAGPTPGAPIAAAAPASHGRPASALLDLPPLGVLVLGM